MSRVGVVVGGGGYGVMEGECKVMGCTLGLC